VARLVEGDLQRSQVRVADRMTRFAYDYPLLFALVDRWRPETHTFHLPVGEMTPTLQDVALLLGLPLAGRPMGATDVPATWRQDLLARFANVQRNALAPPYHAFDNTFGPSKRWILQFTVRIVNRT
jgi:hypothetical protein